MKTITRVFLIPILWLVCIRQSSLYAQAPAKTKKGKSTFTHPGGWLTQADMQRIRKKVASGAEPWKTAWDSLKNSDAGINYKANVSEHISNVYNIQNDGHAAWVLAVKWVASGDMQYAEAAKKLINLWVTTVKSTVRETMRHGLGANQMANAAEIIAYAFNGEAKWPQAEVDAAKTFFKEIIYPNTKNGASANWGTSCMAGNMSMALFCDDRQMFDDAIDVYKHGFVVNGSVKDGCCSATQYIDATGENAESGRDQPHSQGGLAHLAEVALIAWNQGINLVSYNDTTGVRNYGASGANRVFIGHEYTAKYNLGNEVAYHPFFEYCNNVTKYPDGVSAQGRGRFSPMYFMAVRLFENAGLNPVYCKQVTASKGYSPEKTNSDHPGLGTLLFSK